MFRRCARFWKYLVGKASALTLCEIVPTTLKSCEHASKAHSLPYHVA
jgi:hypothetical protein